MTMQDRAGGFPDIVIDVGFIAFDVTTLVLENVVEGRTDTLTVNATALAVDVGCALVPVVSGGGMAVRGGEKVLEHGAASGIVHLFAGTKRTTQAAAHAAGAAKGPPPNGGTANPHGGPVHNSAIDKEIGQLRQDPAVSNIRKNQQQVDVNGDKAGTNRPDIQYDRDGCHTCVEFDTNPSNGTRHGDVIQKNDPSAIVDLRTP